MLMKYEGIDNTSIQRGKDILSIFMLMAHVMVLLELVFYVVLFYNLKEKNRSLKNVVTDDILKVNHVLSTLAQNLYLESGFIFILDTSSEKYHYFGWTIHHICYWMLLWYPSASPFPSRISELFIWTRSHSLRHDVHVSFSPINKNFDFARIAKTFPKRVTSENLLRTYVLRLRGYCLEPSVEKRILPDPEKMVV